MKLLYSKLLVNKVKAYAAWLGVETVLGFEVNIMLRGDLKVVIDMNVKTVREIKTRNLKSIWQTGHKYLIKQYPHRNAAW